MAQREQIGQDTDKIVSEIRSDFKIVGKSRVRSWYIWAGVGIILGMIVAVIYIAKRSL